MKITKIKMESLWYAHNLKVEADLKRLKTEAEILVRLIKKFGAK